MGVIPMQADRAVSRCGPEGRPAGAAVVLRRRGEERGAAAGACEVAGVEQGVGEGACARALGAFVEADMLERGL